MLQAAKYIGSGLATIGLTKIILAPVLSPKTLCPSVISHLAERAIVVVNDMLISLPKDSIVLKHIQDIASSTELGVVASLDEGLVTPFSPLEFPNGDIPSGVPLGTGVYAFTEKSASKGETKVRQAIGSAVSFPVRLGGHKDQFSGRSKATNLHNVGNTMGGLSMFTWGPIYFLPNYLSSFYANYPGYKLTQGEYNILMAVTQLCPRILEQSLLHSVPSTLSGKDRLVRFTYTSFNLSSLNQPLNVDITAVQVEVLVGDKVIDVSVSKNQLLLILGIASRGVLDRYMNHVTPINSPILGPVNIRVLGYKSPLLTHPIIHRTPYELMLPDLQIPGLDSPYDLPIGPVFVYNEDKTPFQPDCFDSIAAAAKFLNPNTLKPRGREIKISRVMGLDELVLNELGSFYFMENPENDRFKQNQSGVYPCHLYDLQTGTSLFYEGLRPIVRDLSWFTYPGTLRNPGEFKVTYDRLKKCYDNSSSLTNARILYGRFMVIPAKL